MPDALILPWRDMLHDGPVPAGLPLPALSQLRAGWLARELGLDPAAVAAEFALRDRRFLAVPAGSELVLCFEHDLYDQLQLIQLLSELRPRAGELRVTLAQADDYLAPQAPAALAALLARRRPVDGGSFGAAAWAWAAVREPTPETLAAATGRVTDGLPWLAPALLRLLEELPDAAGVSRTERAVLQLLARGPMTPAALFEAAGELEAARFLGDWPFFRRLAWLAAEPRPLIAGLSPPSDHRGWLESRLEVTELGRAVLRGGHDRLADHRPARWLGGTDLAAGPLWRWLAPGRLSA